MKLKQLLLLTSLCLAGSLGAMEQPQAPGQEKIALMQFDLFMQLPDEIKLEILMHLASGNDLETIIKTFRALAVTSKPMNYLVNDAPFAKELIAKLVEQFPQETEITIAAKLGTKQAKEMVLDRLNDDELPKAFATCNNDKDTKELITGILNAVDEVCDLVYVTQWMCNNVTYVSENFFEIYKLIEETHKRFDITWHDLNLLIAEQKFMQSFNDTQDAPKELLNILANYIMTKELFDNENFNRRINLVRLAIVNCLSLLTGHLNDPVCDGKTLFQLARKYKNTLMITVLANLPEVDIFY